MTYGVYSIDKKAVALSDKDLETARRYLRKGEAIFTEKWITADVFLSVAIGRWWGIGIWRRLGVAQIGPIAIKWGRNRMKWADKLVEEYHA